MSSHLPIALFRDQIVESVKNNPVTIIVAETGSGKSSRTPQYLHEAGYEVVITQPRRLAARTLSEYVASLMNVPLGSTVGYRTSQDNVTSDQTSITYVTDGLQLVSSLMDHHRHNGTRVLIIDELHEWNINIELLVSWAKRQIETNPHFRIVLMSATLDSERLSEFFNNAPVINVPGRLFTVTDRHPQPKMIDDIRSLVQEGRNVLVFKPGKAEIEEMIEDLHKTFMTTDVMILPLHSELENEEQKKCFAHYSVPKVVISTNVAQTSVTIDDIDAVVDSGMERRIELVDGVEGLYLRSISKADSLQRKGRAGRTKPGIYIDHCKDYEGDRLDYPLAEIERVRLDQTVLRLAEVGFDMETMSFFHQPDKEAASKAKVSLVNLGCLRQDGSVTPIGRRVSRFPVSVEYGRMLVEAEEYGVVGDVITIAAILEAGELQLRKDKDGYPNTQWKRCIQDEMDSDAIAQLNMYRHVEHMSKSDMIESGIRPGAFFRAKAIRNNLERSLKKFVKEVDGTGVKADIIKAVTAGMVNNVYRRMLVNYTNGTSVLRQLNKDSCVMGMHHFVVGIPFDLQIKTRFGDKTLNLIRMATKVSLTTLQEVAPHLLRTVKDVNPRFVLPNENYFQGNKVLTTTQTWFGDILISEAEVEHDHHPDMEALIFERYAQNTEYRQETMLIYNKYNQIEPVKRIHYATHPHSKERLFCYEMFVETDTPYVFKLKMFKTETEASVAYEHLIDCLVKYHDKDRSFFEKKGPRAAIPEVTANIAPTSGKYDNFADLFKRK